jgi:hypothetical protein
MEISKFIGRNKMSIGVIKPLLLLMLCLHFAGCAPLRIDGPYKGQIINEQTSQPIEGVVVDATWHRVYPNVAGSSSTYYDTRETLTDKNGEFKIPGMGLLVFSFIDKANITIFKAGYDGVSAGWVALDDNHLGQWRGKVTRDDGKLVIRLKRLSMKERRKQSGPNMPLDAPASKLKLLMLESNKENIEIGLPKSTLYTVE